MKAVILAAGEGRRLRPFTHSQPKVMIRIANKPILGYVVDALVKNGIEEIVMIVGYKKEHIMSYFEEGKQFGARITYAQQGRQIGTGHALAVAKPDIDSDFLVLPGDNIIDELLVGDLVKSKANPAIVVTESEIPSKYGVVRLSGDTVMGFKEKPEEDVGRMISTGIFKFPKEAMDEISDLANQGKCGLIEIAQHILDNGTGMSAVRSRGTWIDAVYPWDLVGLNEMAMRECEKRTSGTIEPGVVIKGNVNIGKDVIIRSGSYIVGPCTIGAGSEIGPFAHIEPATSIGENSKISSFSAISNSIIGSDVTIEKGCVLSCSVVDDGVAIKSNFTAEKGTAKIEWRGALHIVESVGAMIGEDTKIAPQCSAVPGTVVGAGCEVASGTVLRGSVENKTKIM